MWRRASTIPCAAVALLAVVVMSSAAFQTDPGFKALFDGRDLAGWIYGTRQGQENRHGLGYQVSGGVIYCTRQDGGNLFTEK